MPGKLQDRSCLYEATKVVSQLNYIQNNCTVILNIKIDYSSDIYIYRSTGENRYNRKSKHDFIEHVN